WRLIPDAAATDVWRAADDGEPLDRFDAGQMKPPAKGFPIGPQLLGHGLVDHGDWRAAHPFRIGEVAAFQKRNADRSEEMRRDPDESDLRFFIAREGAS